MRCLNTELKEINKTPGNVQVKHSEGGKPYGDPESNGFEVSSLFFNTGLGGSLIGTALLHRVAIEQHGELSSWCAQLAVPCPVSIISNFHITIAICDSPKRPTFSHGGDPDPQQRFLSKPQAFWGVYDPPAT